MSGADLWEDGYPHGTVDGFDGGCRGGACPADAEIGMSCKRAKSLSNGDIRYNRLAAAGKSPAEIAAIIDGRAEPTTEAPAKPAPKQRAPKPTTARPEAPAEESTAGPAITETTSADPTSPADIAEPPTFVPGGVGTDPDITVIAETQDSSESYIPINPASSEKNIAFLNEAGKRLNASAGTSEAPTTAETDTTEPSHPEIDPPAHNTEETAVPETPLTTEKYTAGHTQAARTFILRGIREWARANGFPGVPTHGKIPQDALAAFDAAHPNGIVDTGAIKASPAGVAEHVAQLRAVREWARQNGWPDVSDRGPVPDVIREAYDAEHQENAATPTPTSNEDSAPTEADAAPTEPDTAPTEVDSTDDPAATFADGIDAVRERAGLTIDTASIRAGEIEITDGGVFVPRGAIEVKDIRPSWGTVTVSEDVEQARSMAIRLESENALLLEQIALAHRAVEITLTIHAQQQRTNDVLRAELEAMTKLAQARAISIAFDRSTARLTATKIADLEQQIADLTSDLEQARRPWWKRAAR